MSTTPAGLPSTPLRLSELTKTYDGGRPALDGVSVDLEPGSTLCVLGPSGCGKSTLLRLVAGLERPDRGTITLGDRLLSAPARVEPPEHRGVNMVFQDYALWPHMTVADIVGYGLRHGARRRPRAERAARVAELVDFLRLGGLEHRRPAELSGGQQQRVAIARALATSPELLLFDEPLSNLDAQLRGEMRDELAALLSSLGTTALYVTHDVSEALALADRILVLSEGRTLQLDTPQGVFTRPRSGWVAALAGFSCELAVEEAVQLPESRGVGAGSQVVGLEGRAEDRVEVTIRGARLTGRDCGPDDGSSAGPRAFVHPASVRLSTAPGALVGVVESCVFEGRSYRVRVGVPGAGTLVLSSPHRVDRGDQVGVEVDPDGVLVYGARARRTAQGDPHAQLVASTGHRDRHAAHR